MIQREIYVNLQFETACIHVVAVDYLFNKDKSVCNDTVCVHFYIYKLESTINQNCLHTLLALETIFIVLH